MSKGWSLKKNRLKNVERLGNMYKVYFDSNRLRFKLMRILASGNLHLSVRYNNFLRYQLSNQSLSWNGTTSRIGFPKLMILTTIHFGLCPDRQLIKKNV